MAKRRVRKTAVVTQVECKDDVKQSTPKEVKPRTRKHINKVVPKDVHPQSLKTSPRVRVRDEPVASYDFMMLSQSGASEVTWNNDTPSIDAACGDTNNIDELVKRFACDNDPSEMRPSTPPLVSLWMDSPTNSQDQSRKTRRQPIRRVKRVDRKKPSKPTIDSTSILNKLTAVLQQNQENEKKNTSGNVERFGYKVKEEPIAVNGILASTQKPLVPTTSSPLETVCLSPILQKPPRPPPKRTNKAVDDSPKNTSNPLSFIDTPKRIFKAPSAKGSSGGSISTPKCELKSTPSKKSSELVSTPKSAMKHNSSEELWTDEELFENDSFLVATQTGVIYFGDKSTPSPQLNANKRRMGTPTGGLEKKRQTFKLETSPLALQVNDISSDELSSSDASFVFKKPDPITPQSKLVSKSLQLSNNIKIGAGNANTGDGNIRDAASNRNILSGTGTASLAIPSMGIKTETPMEKNQSGPIHKGKKLNGAFNGKSVNSASASSNGTIPSSNRVSLNTTSARLCTNTNSSNTKNLEGDKSTTTVCAGKNIPLGIATSINKSCANNSKQTVTSNMSSNSSKNKIVHHSVSGVVSSASSSASSFVNGAALVINNKTINKSSSASSDASSASLVINKSSTASRLASTADCSPRSFTKIIPAAKAVNSPLNKDKNANPGNNSIMNSSMSEELLATLAEPDEFWDSQSSMFDDTMECTPVNKDNKKPDSRTSNSNEVNNKMLQCNAGLASSVSNKLNNKNANDKSFTNSNRLTKLPTNSNFNIIKEKEVKVSKPDDLNNVSVLSNISMLSNVSTLNPMATSTQANKAPASSKRFKFKSSQQAAESTCVSTVKKPLSSADFKKDCDINFADSVRKENVHQSGDSNSSTVILSGNTNSSTVILSGNVSFDKDMDMESDDDDLLAVLEETESQASEMNAVHDESKCTTQILTNKISNNGNITNSIVANNKIGLQNKIQSAIGCKKLSYLPSSNVRGERNSTNSTDTRKLPSNQNTVQNSRSNVDNVAVLKPVNTICNVIETGAGLKKTTHNSKHPQLQSNSSVISANLVKAPINHNGPLIEKVKRGNVFPCTPPTSSRSLQKFPSHDCLNPYASPKTAITHQGLSSSQDSKTKSSVLCAPSEIEKKKQEALRRRQNKLKLTTKKPK